MPPATATITPEANYRAKDFAIVARDSQGTVTYHAFYILTYNGGGDPDSTERRLGHSRSSDLIHWEYMPSVLPARSDNWDNCHIWAPTIVAQADSFYMFYTGVDTSNAWRRQRIGLAVSSDLSHWIRMDSPIFDCNKAPWTWCDSTTSYGQDFRDPFVTVDPRAPGKWIMLYATRMREGTTSEGNMVPGLARSSGDLRVWEDAGPLWTYGTGNWWNNQPKFESPHLYSHVFPAGDTLWYLHFTSSSSQSLEFVTSSSPTDSGAAWNNQYRVANMDCVSTLYWSGSEYFRDPVGGGEYFGAYGNVSIELWKMHWQPVDRFSFDVIRPAPVYGLDVVAGRTSAIVQLTVSGDDSLKYTACQLRVTYATTPVSDANFFSCDTLPTPVPDTSGTSYCIAADIGTLSPCTTYYFGARIEDDARNWSTTTSTGAVTTSCFGFGEVFCTGGEFAGGGGESALRSLAAERSGELKFALLPERPNPVGRKTEIRFRLPAARLVQIRVFDMQGRLVAVPCDRLLGPGAHAVEWDMRATDGSRVRPGVYVCSLVAGTAVASNKLIVLPAGR